MNEQTRISLERAAELKSKIDDYIQARKTINRGLEMELKRIGITTNGNYQIE